jgi:hypothetical protein
MIEPFPLASTVSSKSLHTCMSIKGDIVNGESGTGSIAFKELQNGYLSRTEV